MESIKRSLLEGLSKYKKMTINLDDLIALAVGIDPKALKSLDLLNASEYKKMKELRTLYFSDFSAVIVELSKEHILAPYGREKEKYIWKSYRVVANQGKPQRDKDLIAKIMSYRLPGMEYYTKKLQEFKKDQAILEQLNAYYLREDKKRLTANELGFLLFQDEKAFEQGDGSEVIGYALTIIKKLSLDIDKYLNAYITIEPFFYLMKESFFEKRKEGRKREILIIENKDTYYTFYQTELGNPYDMIIYGEGNKINSSFSLAGDYGILKSDNLYYFGDIDPVGFAIYGLLSKKYNEYSIEMGYPYYKRLIQYYMEEECPRIKHDKVEPFMLEAKEVIQRSQTSDENGFTEEEKDFLARIFQEKRYIPQEAIGTIGT